MHVNCAALPEQLLESELFGHVRGAFTNAYFDKDGLLIEANGGTIFLDEIGKTSMAMQGKLLQFLDSGKVRKVGSNDLMAVDVRVVCASKSNLLKMVDEGRFLEDFFYRINDFPLTVPPLRERREDIPLLMNHYVEKLSREMAKTIDGTTPEFMEKLAEYHWPGNVRELEKVIKRAIILADDGEALDVRHLAPEVLRTAAERRTPSPARTTTLRERIEQIEQAMILDALRRHSREQVPGRRAPRHQLSESSLEDQTLQYPVAAPARGRHGPLLKLLIDRRVDLIVSEVSVSSLARSLIPLFLIASCLRSVRERRRRVDRRAEHTRK